MLGSGEKKQVIFQRLKTINYYIPKLYMDNFKEIEIKELILNYVKNQYLEDEETVINYSTKLISGGIVDSFSMVSLLVFIENKFKIRIPANKATPEAFDSVNDIFSLVTQFIQISD
jgi:acyl carrier protein